MVELVTRMMELKKQQTRAPKKQSPSARQLLDQKLAITDGQIDQLVYELYGLSDDEIRIVEDAGEIREEIRDSPLLGPPFSQAMSRRGMTGWSSWSSGC